MYGEISPAPWMAVEPVRKKMLALTRKKKKKSQARQKEKNTMIYAIKENELLRC